MSEEMDQLVKRVTLIEQRITRLAEILKGAEEFTAWGSGDWGLDLAVTYLDVEALVAFAQDVLAMDAGANRPDRVSGGED